MRIFGQFMAIVLTFTLIPIINGFVLSTLWGWLIVPIFEIQPLRVIEAIGILVIISFLNAHKISDGGDKDFWIKFGQNVIVTILLAVHALFVGWVVTQFI